MAMWGLGYLWPRGWHALSGCLVLLAAACTTPIGIGESRVYPSDPRVQYPISVERSVATLGLPGAADGVALSATEIARLDGFVGNYIAGGHGHLVITVPATGQQQTLTKAKRIVDHTLGRGLRSGEVSLRVATAESSDRGQIVLSYDTFVVRVPECGDWSKESSHDATNSVHSNFGCAMQRNVALMIANPADLVAPRMAGLRDATRSNQVIQLYRAGEVTIAERAAVEEADVITEAAR